MGMEEFVSKLKESMEEHSGLLKSGQLFLPEYLKGKRFTNNFGPILEAVAKKLGLDSPKKEFSNTFPSEYKLPNQRVDFAFLDKTGKPIVFFELESLDRSQLYLFTDAYLDPEKEFQNKLWYYWGTLCNHYTKHKKAPNFFVFMLILPDRSVEPYQLWDTQKTYQIYAPSLRDYIFDNPFRFYDRQIKASARSFLHTNMYFPPDHERVPVPWEEAQQVCELVFITCTLDKLILSRGRDRFDVCKERLFEINWNGRKEEGVRNRLSGPVPLMPLRRERKTSQSKEREMAKEPIAPLTPDDQAALRKVLPEVIKRFCNRPDYRGITENKTYYAAWFEMPNLPEEYPSIGFETLRKSTPLFWTVPLPPQSKRPAYLAAGYQEENTYFWKYGGIPLGFSGWNVQQQMDWAQKLITGLLEEDERLRGS